MRTVVINPFEHIIWSGDVPGVIILKRHLDGMFELEMVKVDRLFTDSYGRSIIDQLRERGLRVFADAKLVEVPSKLAKLAEVYLRHGPWMLNCMAGSESSGVLLHEDPEKIDGLKRFADACHAYGTLPCAVTVLTSKTPEVVAREFNGRTAVEQVLHYVEVLAKCGFTDVVCSPQEAAAIRTERRFDHLDLNCPGIRPSGSDARDQARTNTPEAALAAGVNRLVIGGPITDGDPPANLRRIAASIVA
jgi:orotidine-5'-phosphate decarboxylase